MKLWSFSTKFGELRCKNVNNTLMHKRPNAEKLRNLFEKRRDTHRSCFLIKHNLVTVQIIL